MRITADGVARGLMTVSYERDEYRPTVRVDGQNVLVGVEIGTMREAIRASNDLACYWKAGNEALVMEARHG